MKTNKKATLKGNNERGLGVLTCHICDGRIIDHAIGPCPTLGGDRLYVSEGTMFGKRQRSVGE